MSLSHTPEYKIWDNIKQRCLNPNNHAYQQYGGRGIQMHAEWVHSFANFRRYLLDSIGLRPGKIYSIDRVEVNGHYAPGNLQWATQFQQNNNRQRTSEASNTIQFQCDLKWRRMVKSIVALRGETLQAVCVEAVNRYLKIATKADAA